MKNDDEVENGSLSSFLLAVIYVTLFDEESLAELAFSPFFNVVHWVEILYKVTLQVSPDR